MSTLELDRGSPADAILRVIDCDIHPAMNAWTEVHPYLAKKWIEHLAVYGSHLRHAFSEALTHPRMSPDAARVDAYPDEGGPPELQPGADARASISIPTASPSAC